MANCTATLTIDLLNRQPFLAVMQLAIDVCASGERVADDPSVENLGVLDHACQEFRRWFREGSRE